MTPLGRVRLRRALAEARAEDRTDEEDTDVTSILKLFALEVNELERTMGIALKSQDTLLWRLADRFGGSRMPKPVGDSEECEYSAGSAAIRSDNKI